MGTGIHDRELRRGWLSQAIKALRRHRGLRPREVAAALGMALRTYEHFEAGRTMLNVERIHQLAGALRADPYAILMALEIGSPAFAVRAADNKIATIATMAFQDFDASTGDAISQLDAETLMTGFERLFSEFSELARKRAAVADGWLSGPAPPQD